MSDGRVWTGELGREYGLKRLSRSDLNEDPMAQFETWFEEGRPTVQEPSAMAFATADSEGLPSCRMVLMKSFDHRGIVFATSYLSRKGLELAENPAGAALFYWPALERQVRMTGQMEETTAEESDEIFGHRHPLSRIATRVSHQSKPIESREALEGAYFAEQKRLEGQDAPRPRTWGGYRLMPVEIEFWQGGEHRLHDRFVYRPSREGWTIERLQP